MDWSYVDIGEFRDWLYGVGLDYKRQENFAQNPEKVKLLNGFLDWLITIAQVEQEQASAAKHADPLYKEPTCCGEKEDCSHG